MQLEELLRYHRKQAGLTQKALANKVGYDHSFVSRLEKGQRQPTQEYITAFIKTLHLPLAEAQQIQQLFGYVLQLNLPDSARMYWAEAPDVTEFYGRTTELAQLSRWINAERCRVVGVFGLGGIGKTALVARLTVHHLRAEFQAIYWQPLINAPPLSDVLRRWIQFFSGQKEIYAAGPIEAQIEILLNYLRQQRRLIILDNAETILQIGDIDYRYGYEDYSQLFQRVSATDHQSCVVFTGREKPPEFALLEGEVLPVRSLTLTGLSLTDGQALLEQTGLSGSPPDMHRLVQQYSGNPLALRLIAESMVDQFDGDVASFLKRQSADVWRDIGAVLEQQFNRLLPLEQEILYWLALAREAMAVAELRYNLLDAPPARTLLSTLTNLRQRSLLERTERGFTLQNMVIEYLSERLVNAIADELLSQTLVLFRRYALLAASGREYVRNNQTRLILTPLLDNLRRALGSRTAVVDCLNQALASLHRESRQSTGYAAGNILNLLVCLDEDLRGYDFSGLSVWQVYLRGVTLPAVNFAQADLRQAIFTNTFDHVLSVTFSRDGYLLGAGTARGEVRLWNLIDGQQIMAQQDHTDWVRMIRFHPTENILVSSSDDHTVKLWDVETGRCLQTLYGHTGRVLVLALSPDGQWLATAGEDEQIRLWSARTWELHAVITGHDGWVWGLAFHPDSNRLASACYDNMIRLWDVTRQQWVRSWPGHVDWSGPLAFSPDGTLLASGGSEGAVKLWHAETGTLVHTMEEHRSYIWSVAFSPDGRLLASASHDQTVRLWSVATGECMQVLTGHTKWVRSVEFNPDGTLLSSGSDDQSIKLWDTKIYECTDTLKGYTSQIRILAFDTAGEVLVSGGSDETVRFWNVETGTCFQQFGKHDNSIWALALHPTKPLLATGGGWGIPLWHWPTAHQTHYLTGHAGWVMAVAFHPAGDLLASSSEDGTAKLWQTSSGKCTQTFVRHQNWVWAVTFSPAGDMLATGSEDHTICLWLLDSEQPLRQLTGHTGAVYWVAFTPDGNRLVSASRDGTLRVWDVFSGQCTAILTGHTKQVRCLALGNDGTMLVSGGLDQTVRVWNINTETCDHVLTGHSDAVWTVAISPNQPWVVSGSLDESIRVWNYRTGHLLNTYQPERPYEGLNIIGATGLSEAQRRSLKSLGAVD